jgi:hypothetical protein
VHFPLATRYARTLDLPFLGMTGKFHTFWGDFHSYKNQAALEYECFRMLALGGGCSIGDQLHPNGKLDQPTYDLIGAVYKQVAAKESWCINVESVSNIGVFSPEIVTGEQIPDAGAGVQCLLEELGHQFDFIDGESNFADYRLLILPDEAFINEDIPDKLKSYLSHGGAIIASYEALLNLEHTEVALSDAGLKWMGEMQFEPTFIVPDGKIGSGLPEVAHVMYQSGLKVVCDDSGAAQILSECLRPYFNRTWKHYTSHRHASSDGSVYAAAITRKDNLIYFAHPIFKQYNDNAPLWVKTLVKNAISMLIGDSLVIHDGPSTLMVALNRQVTHRRLILHALHYIPIRRSATMDVIEDVIPLHNVTFNIYVDRQVNQVMRVPDREAIDFEQQDNRVSFVLPCINGHEMVVIE